MTAYMHEWRSARDAGKSIGSPHRTSHWRPDELPGRRPFNAAHEALNSRVEAIVTDFMTADPNAIGSFDVVLFLGVLYHLEEPLTAVRRVFELTAPGGLCVIETEAMEIPGSGSRALVEFFPGDELNGDASNWWAPNAAALTGMCRAAGFSRVETQPERQPIDPLRRLGKAVKRSAARVPFSGVPRRYRLIVHATR
jgi:tRNA (mo5U34)-methyltransferase